MEAWCCPERRTLTQSLCLRAVRTIRSPAISSPGFVPQNVAAALELVLGFLDFAILFERPNHLNYLIVIEPELFRYVGWVQRFAMMALEKSLDLLPCLSVFDVSARHDARDRLFQRPL